MTFTSPNETSNNDLLRRITLAILSGQNRCARGTALHAENVKPQGLGMTRLCGEYSGRRAFAPAVDHGLGFTVRPGGS